MAQVILPASAVAVGEGRSVAAHALHRSLRIAAVIGALVTVPLTYWQEHGHDHELAIDTLNWLIWGLFVAEFVAGLLAHREKWVYVRASWITLAIVVLTFPLEPESFEVLRLARPLVIALWGLRRVSAVFGRSGLLHVAATSILLVLAAGGLMVAIEPDAVHHEFWNGVWWAVVTTTTVGYGDISPTSVGGRLIAIMLMIAGIGLTSTLAAAVAAHFVSQDDPGARALEARLDRIEALLAELAARQTNPSPPQ